MSQVVREKLSLVQTHTTLKLVAYNLNIFQRCRVPNFDDT